MSGWWETSAIVALVASAASYLAYRSWQTLRGKASGCGSCSQGTCSAAKPAPLLSIQPQPTAKS